MQIRWSICSVVIAAVLALAAADRKTRGLVDNVGKLWSNVFNTGFDQFQEATMRQAERLRPWAARVEEEMAPAMKRVEQSLGSAFDVFADSLSFPTTHRRRVVTTQRRGQNDDDAEDDDEREPTSGPGLHDFMFGGSALDPFAIFGVSRRKWWEGDNVCVERKVVKESDEEEVVDDGDADSSNATSTVSTTSKPKSNGGKRGGRVFDMSFTTCRDTDTLHECTTHINADGLKETITVTYECCYGYVRDESGPGCFQTAMTDLRTTMNDMGVNEFVELLTSANLDGVLDQNVTIFAPTNDAVEDFRHDSTAQRRRVRAIQRRRRTRQPSPTRRPRGLGGSPTGRHYQGPHCRRVHGHG